MIIKSFELLLRIINPRIILGCFITNVFGRCYYRVIVLKLRPDRGSCKGTAAAIKAAASFHNALARRGKHHKSVNFEIHAWRLGYILMGSVPYSLRSPSGAPWLELRLLTLPLKTLY